MTVSPKPDEFIFITGTRADFEALIKGLSYEAFAYNPTGLAAARAYDSISEALTVVIEAEEGDYDEVEMGCRACMGPCGRCHE